MKQYLDLFCYIFTIIGFFQTSECVIFKCPTYQLHFQKVLGYRPLVSPEPNGLLARGKINSVPSTINLECWAKCKSDLDCVSYVLLFNSSECYGFTRNEKSKKYSFLQSENVEFCSDANVAYFEKTCLDVPEDCSDRAWPIVRIPGTLLIGQGFKQIETLVTRRGCVESCLHETEFQCKSASFIVSHRNNYQRMGNFNSNNEDVGQCILSREDKSNHPDSFRVANYDEEYIENQCIGQVLTENHCSFEKYTNSTLNYAEVELLGLSEKECQETCLHDKHFNCLGVSYIDKTFTGSKSNTRCFHHSEDVISLGPRAVKFLHGSSYMRRVKCLNLSVICENNEMIVRYLPTHYFVGKMYVNSHSQECSSQGQGKRSAILRIPIGNEIRENMCGIVRAYEISGPQNRTLISTLVVIQNHPSVQTQGDRLIKVGCILNNKTGSANSLPDNVALESKISFNQDDSIEGTLLLNENDEKFPVPIMKVIDLDKNVESSDVQLGQNLELRIFTDPPNSFYDIRAVEVIAKSSDGQQILLIDKRGCPHDLSVFPSMQKSIIDGKRMLSARFHAFKFAGTTTVKFELMIQFCPHQCDPIYCDNSVLSYGKRRRRRKRSVTTVEPRIVNTDIGPITFPDTTKKPIEFHTTFRPVTFPGSGFFSNRSLRNIENIYDYRISNVENVGEIAPLVKERNEIRVESNDVIYQRVLSNFDDPRDARNRKLLRDDIYEDDEDDTKINASANVKETSRNNFTDNKRILRRMLELPLELNLNVRDLVAGEAESLIYGESSQILVAGIDVANMNNLVCVDQTVMIVLIIMWILLQIILMTGCCVLIKKYKRLAEMEEDRSSLHKIHHNLDQFDSLSRRVHWADQNSHVMFQ